MLTKLVLQEEIMSGMSIFKHGSWIAEKSISDLCREMQAYI